MKEKLDVHETAFLISMFRASNEFLSKDLYAELWVNAKTKLLADELINNVSEHEPFTHCLRNRYFYETMKGLIDNKKIEVIINFGCGFSMYPFLLDKRLTYIEIDKPDVIKYKKEKIEMWQKENALPNRDLHFISSHFQSGYETKLLAEILRIKKDRPSFILIEGVLFFLLKKETEITFELFSNIQTKGDYIGSVSYRKEMEETDVFQRLLMLFKDQLTLGQQFHYQTISDDFYHDQRNYKLIDYQDYYMLSKTYSPQEAFDDQEDILNESMYLLLKTK
jgi:O-methyltransferase involved in polyketide biosynthesis